MINVRHDLTALHFEIFIKNEQQANMADSYTMQAYDMEDKKFKALKNFAQ